MTRYERQKFEEEWLNAWLSMQCKWFTVDDVIAKLGVERNFTQRCIDALLRLDVLAIQDEDEGYVRTRYKSRVRKAGTKLQDGEIYFAQGWLEGSQRTA